jgi:hypothetical protein
MKSLLGFLLIASLALAVEPTGTERVYKITNVAGPVTGREGDFRLRLHENIFSIVNKRTKQNLDITAAQITHVLYTTHRFSRVDQVPAPVAGSCYSDAGCGGMVMFYIAAALVMAPMHGHNHFLRVTWSDRNVEQQLQFEIGKDDYQPVLDALKSFGGVKYVDLEDEARRVRSELEENAKNAATVNLEHASKLGDYDLAGGEYRLIALDRGQSQADVYVFLAEKSAKIQPEKLKAAVRAVASDSAAGDGIAYGESSARIRSICAAGRTYTFVVSDER